MEMGFIRRDVPITDDPDRSRNGLYVFNDNYSAFFFEFVGPFRSSLELEDADGAIEYWKKHFSEHLVPFVFEEECRRSVYRMPDDIGFVPRRVGRYWDKHCDIGVVALDTDSKKAFVAECKYHQKEPMDSSDLKKLIIKADPSKHLTDMISDMGYSPYQVSLTLYIIKMSYSWIRGKGSTIVIRIDWRTNRYHDLENKSSHYRSSCDSPDCCRCDDTDERYRQT